MRRRGIFTVVLVLVLLALFWTYPLISRINDTIPYTIVPDQGLEIVPLYPGDHLQFYYRLWFFYDSIKKGRPFSGSTYEFNNNMGRRTISGRFVPLSLIYAMFAPLGNALSYNLLFLLTFPLTGLCTYLVIKSYGGSFWGGMAGAVTAAFMPYRMGQLAAGHPNAFVYFVIPLLIWVFEEYMRTGTKRMAWLAGLVFFSQMIMELHAAFYTVMLMAVYLPIRILIPVENWFGYDDSGPEPLSDISPRWLIFLPPAALFVFRIFYLRLSADVFPGWTVALVSASVWAGFLLIVHGALAAVVASFFRLGIGYAATLLNRVFLPLAVLLLYGLRFFLPIPYLGKSLLIALVLMSAHSGLRIIMRLFGKGKVRIDLRNLLMRGRNLIFPLAVSLSASVIWILYLRRSLFSGTSVAEGRSIEEAMLFTPVLADSLSRANKSIEFYLYPGLVCLGVIAAGVFFILIKNRFQTEKWPLYFFGGLASVSYLLCFGLRGNIILPVYEAMRGIPYLSYGRVSSRAMLLFVPAFSILVGMFLSNITTFFKAERLKFLIGSAVVLGILADFWPASSLGLTRLPEGNLVYEEKIPAANGNKIVEIPLWPGDSAWSSIYQYWVTRYEHDMINGYSPVVPEDYYEEVFEPLAGINVGYLTEREASLLRRLGVNRLILHEEVFPPKVSLFPFKLTLDGLRSSPYLEYLLKDGWLRVFEVLDSPKEETEFMDFPTSPMGLVFQAEHNAMRPGGMKLIGTGRAAVGAGPGMPVISGPSRLFPPGRFRGRLKMGHDGKNSSEVPATLRVLDQSGELLGESVLYLKQPEGTLVDHDFNFEIKQPRRLTFELYQPADASLFVDYLYILYEDMEDPPKLLEFEDLPHAGRIIEDAAASGGQAVFLQSGEDPAMPFNMGPRRLLPPGSWIISVRYKTEEGSGDAGAVLIGEHGGPAIEELILVPQRKDGYAEVSAIIELEKEVFFDLGVVYSGGRDLSLDRIEVRQN